MSYNIDEMDLQIIQRLQEDGRQSYRDIAADIGVTERTVRLRVQQLKNEGIIQIIGIVNPVKMGRGLIALVQVAVLVNELENCVRQFETMEEVRFIALTSGEYELILEVCVANHEELSDFMLHKLNKVKGVLKSNMILELKILKNDYRFITVSGE